MSKTYELNVTRKYIKLNLKNLIFFNNKQIPPVKWIHLGFMQKSSLGKSQSCSLTLFNELWFKNPYFVLYF